MLAYRPWLAMAATVCCFAVSMPAQGSVVIGGTRVIYPERDREVTIRLSNDGAAPALVQAWLDRGDADADPATINVPFTLTPPMFRIDPAKGQSLRIIYTQEALPADRESVFWLNVLEVPPRTGTADANSMQIAFRSRIKLFFRPRDLAGHAADAPARLQWQIATDAAGAQVLRVTNPTAYHVSFSAAGATSGGVTYHNTSGGMVAPMASFDFPLIPADNAAPPATGSQAVQFTWINDYGANVSAHAPLGGAS